MMKNPLCAALMVLGVLVTAVSASSQTRGRTVPTLTISATSISPTRLTATGGSVSVRVKVVARLATVRGVTAKATLGTGTSGTVATLRNLGSGIYSGTVSVPRNPGTTSIFANIVASVDWTGPGSPTTKSLGTVRLDGTGSNSNGPPPPPPI